MSRYITNSLAKSTHVGYGHINDNSNSNIITIASAQQAPQITLAPTIITSTSTTRIINKTQNDAIETESIVKSNYDGGVSFSLEAVFDLALSKNDSETANRCLVAIIEQLSIFGTCDTRVDINSTTLTDTSKTTFYKLCLYNLDLVVSTIRNVYLSGRAPKVSHSIYLIALLTSSPIDKANINNFRAIGYDMVQMFRITTHLFEWIHTHISLCSIDAQKDKPKTKAKGKPKLVRTGGTGAGFRRAVQAWYTSKCPKSLATQIVKYPNRHGFSHGDVLSLAHIKTTSRKRNCIETQNVTDIIPIACQVSLAFAVGGLQQAKMILLDCIDRAIDINFNTDTKTNIFDALKIFAFLCAVDRAKQESTSVPLVCKLIRIFGLTREMISNTKLNTLPVLQALLVSTPSDLEELCGAQAYLLKHHLPCHTLIDSLFPFTDLTLESSEEITTTVIPIEIGMPITALIRNLNNLTSSGMFDDKSTDLIKALTTHLTNENVLHKGLVHPINLFNAWAVYSQGKGFLGSKTWTPVKEISDAVLEAVEIAFKGLSGFDVSVAFLMDASSSMSSPGSAPGMPCLKALDIAVLLILTLYRATANYASMYGKPMPNHSVGYFGGKSCWFGGRSFSTNTSTNTSTNKNLSLNDTTIVEKASSFKDVTNKFSPTMTFQDAKIALGNGDHMGMTDIGSALWSLIGRLKRSLDIARISKTVNTVFELDGYYELLLLVTDNDVNSGDQPMDVLSLYWNLVSEAFDSLPFNKDGSPSNPSDLFNRYIPRLVIVATQGTNITIGDPRDKRILTISGFDASAPTLIDTFIKQI